MMAAIVSQKAGGRYAAELPRIHAAGRLRAGSRHNRRAVIVASSRHPTGRRWSPTMPSSHTAIARDKPIAAALQSVDPDGGRNWHSRLAKLKARCQRWGTGPGAVATVGRELAALSPW